MTSTAANSEACQSGRVTLSISGGPGCTSRSLDRLIAGAGNALYAARPNGKDHIVASPAYGPGHGFRVEIIDWQSAPTCRSRSAPGHAELPPLFGQRTRGRTVR